MQEGFRDIITDEPSILKKSNLSELRDYYILYRGVETRDNSRYLSNSKRDEFDLPILNATDVEKYFCEWKGLYVRFVPEELKSNADIKMYQLPEKVLLRRTGDSLISCVDTNEYLVTKNLYLLIPKEDLSAHFLCAILNSKLMNWERKRRTRDQGQAFAQLKGSDIASFPIYRISFTTPADERARQGAELQDLFAAGKHAEILAAVKACLPKDEAGSFIAEQERSDVVHDLLAFLAERMLEMNKDKQQEIRGFLGWLEGYVGAKVEDLTPKTKLQGYYEHDYESFLAVLRKNKKKLAVDPARREPAEALRAEFEGSIKKLLPLRERIGQTDELIDAVVYKLYGLTEEEIGIVEGTTRP